MELVKILRIIPIHLFLHRAFTTIFLICLLTVCSCFILRSYFQWKIWEPFARASNISCLSFLKLTRLSLYNIYVHLHHSLSQQLWKNLSVYEKQTKWQNVNLLYFQNRAWITKLNRLLKSITFSRKFKYYMNL